MVQAWTLLIFQLCVQFTCAQVFDISRPTAAEDTFNIPASICDSSPNGCNSFYAMGQLQNPAGCSCVCPATNATFTFANNRWMCMENTRARTHFQRGKNPNIAILSDPKEAKNETRKDTTFILQNIEKQNYQMKVLSSECFHLNGRVIGFHPRTHKLGSAVRGKVL